MEKPPGLCYCPAWVFPHKFGKKCEEWLEAFRTSPPPEEPPDAKTPSD
jgi:hypothetical protein